MNALWQSASLQRLQNARCEALSPGAVAAVAPDLPAAVSLEGGAGFFVLEPLPASCTGVGTVVFCVLGSAVLSLVPATQPCRHLPSADSRHHQATSHSLPRRQTKRPPTTSGPSGPATSWRGKGRGLSYRVMSRASASRRSCWLQRMLLLLLRRPQTQRRRAASQGGARRPARVDACYACLLGRYVIYGQYSTSCVSGGCTQRLFDSRDLSGWFMINRNVCERPDA